MRPTFIYSEDGILWCPFCHKISVAEYECKESENCFRFECPECSIIAILCGNVESYPQTSCTKRMDTSSIRELFDKNGFKWKESYSNKLFYASCALSILNLAVLKYQSAEFKTIVKYTDVYDDDNIPYFKQILKNHTDFDDYCLYSDSLILGICTNCRKERICISYAF